MEMSMKELLLELDRNHLDVFQYDDEDDHSCYVDLEDDFGIVLQLSEKSILAERVELLKRILRDYDNYVEAALRCLNSYGIDLAGGYFSSGIYVGEFSYGTYGFHIFDGFTLSLKREEGSVSDSLNLDVYTVQFKNDGSPLGAALWFE